MNGNFIKSFSEIPGPKSLPFIGTLFYYLPVIGKYKFDELYLNGLKKYNEFGPIIKEEIVPGTNIIWLFNPDDIKKLFKIEGRYPERRSHLALQHYRNHRKDLYNSGGLLPTNGPEWYRLRSFFQKGLSSPKNVRSYISQTNDIVDCFISHLGDSQSSKTEDFINKLSRLFLEILGVVIFDSRLNSFTTEELKPQSKSSKLMESALTINSCILKTDNGLRLWRFWNTPLYNKLKNAHQFMENMAVELIEKKIQKMINKNNNDNDNDDGEKSLLEYYLTSKEIDKKDIIGMCADILLAGIDTTTFSTSFTLYHLATNKEKQEKLFKESFNLLPKGDSLITSDILANAEYLKAVIKESFRLNPISVGIGRILLEDAIFSGYRVPKGNVIVTQNEIICKLDKYFTHPLKFYPERWLKKENKNLNPYLVLPFGHGPRSCIARRLAEQNMQITILKLCRNFKIDWIGNPLGSKSYLINKPDGPLKFTFQYRNI
ncbi:cytochrome P450, putative [Pediculus humanus corporis]|uniref:Cytochrome P450, putative n=1 Tax=Pediculus humanus subsp. corporis TaxID=121224 RepID=E0VJJ0_PEDHC|nr:cytochrome P450, putative [Pediculus humanus corporis]EEB13546.1 cytochrome P450, putative [Pediculus humanus corporis]